MNNIVIQYRNNDADIFDGSRIDPNVPIESNTIRTSIILTPGEHDVLKIQTSYLLSVSNTSMEKINDEVGHSALSQLSENWGQGTTDGFIDNLRQLVSMLTESEAQDLVSSFPGMKQFGGTPKYDRNGNSITYLSIQDQAVYTILIGCATYLSLMSMLSDGLMWDHLPFMFTLPADDQWLTANYMKTVEPAFKSMLKLSKGPVYYMLRNTVSFLNSWSSIWVDGVAVESEKLMMELIDGFATESINRACDVLTNLEIVRSEVKAIRDTAYSEITELKEQALDLIKECAQSNQATCAKQWEMLKTEMLEFREQHVKELRILQEQIAALKLQVNMDCSPVSDQNIVVTPVNDLQTNCNKVEVTEGVVTVYSECNEPPNPVLVPVPTECTGDSSTHPPKFEITHTTFIITDAPRLQ